MSTTRAETMDETVEDFKTSLVSDTDYTALMLQRKHHKAQRPRGEYAGMIYNALDLPVTE